MRIYIHMEALRFLEFLGLTLAINLTIFFCKVNIFLLFNESPQKNYSVLHYRVKIGKIQGVFKFHRQTAMGGFKVYFGKLVRVVCVAISLRYSPMNVPLREGQDMHNLYVLS
jgi:hypothetical protein